MSQKVPRNVVIVYADDLGFGDLSCYGSHQISTPNIDRLCENGLKFTNAYSTCAVCTPSRYSILTGCYPFRNKEAHILPGDASCIIGPKTDTIAKAFKRVGYHTGAIGKWHLGLSDGSSPIDWNKEIDQFARLGVRYKEHNGELRSAEAVFYDTIDALGKMTNETERDSMAMDLFGRSAKELNPLIEAGSKRFKELGKEAHTVGYVMSTENLQKFGELDDAMRRMDNTSKNLKNNFGLALAPILTDLFEVIAKVPIPVIQGLVGLVGAASGFVLVYKGINN